MCFTGRNSPKIHLKMLETAFAQHFHFDAVQMPLNVMDANYDSFEKKVLPVRLKHPIGVLGVKPIWGHSILESETASPIECLYSAMSLPAAVVITGCDSLPILEQASNTARRFRPMSHAETAALLERRLQAAQNGKYKLCKASHHFDGTYHNPQWVGWEGHSFARIVILDLGLIPSIFAIAPLALAPFAFLGWVLWHWHKELRRPTRPKSLMR
jgi:hypothetical protein